MRVSGRYASMAALLLLALFSTTTAHAAISWNVQTVDSNAAGLGSNGYCPIAVDSNNKPSIAYAYYEMQTNSFSVKYAMWNSSFGGFITQQIASGYPTDMALDTNHNPNILYKTVREGYMYASWTGSDWVIQTVDDTGSVYAALALDSAGNPHVAYSTHQALRYVSRIGSTWTTEAVDNGTDIPFGLSLALDSNDKPYILYSNQGLKLATLENSVWNIHSAYFPDSASGVGNMVLDSKGNPHFVYSTGSIGDASIKYASWTGISWKSETVASGLDLEYIGNPGALALDSYDYPHICFISSEGLGSGYRLGYAVWTGANWNIQTVEEAVGRTPVYLAVDSNRIPHISYRRGSITARTNSLMYASASEPVPLASPLLIALPLLLVVAAIAIIAATAVILYLRRKKRKPDMERYRI